MYSMFYIQYIFIFPETYSKDNQLFEKLYLSIAEKNTFLYIWNWLS